MRRGTTPYIEIKTTEDISGYATIVFTIEDRLGVEVDVDNKSGNMVVTSSSVTVKLTQEQTLSLSKGGVKMQIRAVDKSGENAIASNIMQANLEDVLKEGVIGG